METAHELGLRSTATIMFGHVDEPRHWARHLMRIRALQERTGGFTEFVPLPFVHMQSPVYLKGQARKGPTSREAVLMHAVARLALHPRDLQHPGVVGEDGRRGRRRLPRRRRERSRRHPDERKHLARRRHAARAGNAARVPGRADPLARPRAGPAHYALRHAARRADRELVSQAAPLAPLEHGCLPARALRSE